MRGVADEEQASPVPALHTLEFDFEVGGLGPIERLEPRSKLGQELSQFMAQVVGSFLSKLAVATFK